MIESLPLVLGVGSENMFLVVGAAGAIATTLVVLVVIGIALLPSVSDRWADGLGVGDVAEDAPDPAEVVPGYMDPVTDSASTTSGTETTADTSVDESLELTGDSQKSASDVSPVDADSSA